MGMLYMFVAIGLMSLVSAEDYSNNTSVQLLQQYVRINTTTDNDLTEAVEFWTGLAEDLNLTFTKHEFTVGYPVLVIKWEGSDPSLPGIMLNSHMDVVPADEDDGWTYPPFDAILDSDGKIWGRGTQDMKSVGIQYYEAIRSLIESGYTPLRNVYMTLMPDEETGGEHGMIQLLNSTAFTEMNIGFEMDEGTSYDIIYIPIFYQDKSVWQIQVDCVGVAAHGSTLPATNNTATGKCHKVADELLAFRDEQYEIYLAASIYNAGVYTSVNWNKLNGGTANNVIPSTVSLVFDIRLGTTVNETEFEEQINEWISAAGDNITLTWILKNEQTPATVHNSSNPYWSVISSAATDLGIAILPIVPPGATDARYVRSNGIPAFGFSPMPNTPLLLHSVNEYLNASTFLNGISIYKAFIQGLSSLESDEMGDDSLYLYSTV